VLDIASGICWTSALLSKIDDVTEVDSLEFSWHRLNDLAPIICEQLDAHTEKIQRIYGSFYDIRREGYYDLIIMSQAFHHADQPERLIDQCCRALKEEGTILITGEHYHGYWAWFKRSVKQLLTRGRFVVDFYELFKPDEESGDHYYKIQDYYEMFGRKGFSLEHGVIRSRRTMFFIARRSKRQEPI
nr:class I SAM-dependent methyltransferase [Burkholderiales bacterium]